MRCQSITCKLSSTVLAAAPQTLRCGPTEMTTTKGPMQPGKLVRRKSRGGGRPRLLCCLG
eukprot:757950-Hanusia_phi.AAC.5